MPMNQVRTATLVKYNTGSQGSELGQCQQSNYAKKFSEGGKNNHVSIFTRGGEQYTAITQASEAGEEMSCQ
jgi:hypothetical protein